MGSLVAAGPDDDPSVLDAAGDLITVRPSELIRDVRERLRDLGDDAPRQIHVTTARGRHLGIVEVATLRG